MSDDTSITAHTQDVRPDCHWVSLDDWMKTKKYFLERIKELEAQLDEQRPYFHSVNRLLVGDCKKHTGENTPPFPVFMEKYADVCTVCIVDENQRLRDALAEIREIYAGSEGINFVPLTAPEGYLQRLLKQCYQSAVDALKQEGK